VRNLHYGGTEPRRKAKGILPQITQMGAYEKQIEIRRKGGSGGVESAEIARERECNFGTKYS
jgi:hypothetical protein